MTAIVSGRVQYRINILGRSWGGFDATYSYTTNTMPKSVQDVRSLAGDFESVIDYEVIRIRHGGNWSKEWTSRKVVKAGKEPISVE